MKYWYFSVSIFFHREVYKCWVCCYNLQPFGHLLLNKWPRVFIYAIFFVFQIEMKWNECFFFLPRTVVFNNSRIFSTWLIGWFENGCFFHIRNIYMDNLPFWMRFALFLLRWIFFLMIDVNDDHQYVHPDFFFSIPYMCVNKSSSNSGHYTIFK